MTPSQRAPGPRAPAAVHPLIALAAALLALAGCGRGVLAARAAGVATLEPEEIHRAALEARRYTIVDVRPAEAYAAGHIAGALSVPSEHLDGFFASAEAVEPLVAVCETGPLSVRAAAVAASHDHRAVFSLSGGMARWREERLPLESGAGIAPAPSPAPNVPAPALAQWMVVVSAFAVKPLYMSLTLLLWILLRRSREPALRMLRWGLFAFFAGETACAVNYLATGDESDALELLHQLGMVVFSALLPWALFELLNRRLVHLTAPDAPCLALRFCGRCWKREAVPCGARRLFLAAVPIFALVALVPLCLPLRAGGVRIAVLGSEVTYATSLLLEAVQFRLFPALALLAYLAALVLLLAGEKATRRAALPFFAGLGVSGFSLFRFVLARAFAPMPIWADVWEEVTELAAVAAVAAALWIFREQLGLGRPAIAVEAPGPAGG